jgi:predicted acyltransferase
VFGKNTLFIYLLSEVGVILLYVIPAGDHSLYRSLFVNIFQPIAGDYVGSLLFAVSWMLVCWLVGLFLDKRRIYVRV